ncbi:MAG: DUF2309 domain-containing protein [Candidatus Kapabacteria bacterium]|jgi:hypothetical protein|nr:DUF2309 domain-containing protein [Candidatus Kapabacteria bacterium]
MTTKPIQKYLFIEDHVLHKLRHYLPSQAPLKDFIHHNTLHAFQHHSFHKALRLASEVFGYKVYLPLKDFRARFHSGQIREDVLEAVLLKAKGALSLPLWKMRLLEKNYDATLNARIGEVRKHWKDYGIHLDKLVHPLLFRILSGYLDQGIALWRMPVPAKGLLKALREMERLSSFGGIFTTHRAKRLLQDEHCSMKKLLHIVVGDEALFEQYVFDQQFSHPGWSGMVAFLEEHPHALLDEKHIALHDLIMLELLLEIEMLDRAFGEIWSPLGLKLEEHPTPLFHETESSELEQVCALWQEAFEWSYYDQVLAGIQGAKTMAFAGNIPNESAQKPATLSFQAMFCIDDRECSLRRYVETIEPESRTYGTPGFFNVEFYFQPEHGKFYTKSCPAPLSPNYLIKEIDTTRKHQRDAHFTKHTHSLFRGWFITQTLGLWSALKLAESVFKPTLNPASTHSFRHTDKRATLTIERTDDTADENGLHIGFTVAEMADRIEGLLKSTGLTHDFATLVYLIGHGASSSNNTHYAGYDCGACSGRPGSVNARVAAFMANHTSVRAVLQERGIVIPDTTRFLGALHDTTRDEIEFFDDANLTESQQQRHKHNTQVFAQALDLNAKERSRRFVLTNSAQSPERIHNEMKLRSVSLFEPRPELNHATNTLCIVGRREMTEHLFLDRRAFMNSYDCTLDPDGIYLFNILKAAAPVCGGINLEYYFSRVDNYRLGAGTKLPHNVIGLIGVANGIDGDLRPGLPSQMIEIHDPTRLLMIVQHYPDVVLRTIQKTPELYEWFAHEWIHLVAVHPETGELLRLEKGKFIPYKPLQKTLPMTDNPMTLLESHKENLPVMVLTNKQEPPVIEEEA